jgi:DNA-nicking Smr family endonuclease
MTTPKKPPPGPSTGRIVASIDLHGYQKSEAIARLTEFLDQATRKYSNNNHGGGPCWVEVITGSGKHSSDGRKFCQLKRKNDVTSVNC